MISVNEAFHRTRPETAATAGTPASPPRQRIGRQRDEPTAPGARPAVAAVRPQASHLARTGRASGAFRSLRPPFRLA